MTRALGPRVGMPPQAAMPMLLIGLCWVPVGLVAAVWTGGHIASWMSGQGWAGPALSFDFGAELVKKGPALAWPTTPVELVWGLSAALVLAVVVPVVVAVSMWRSRQPVPGDALGSMARAGDVAVLTPAGVAARAVRLRPTLTGTKPKHVPARQAGWPLGQLRPTGTPLRGSWEDVALILMGPRAGKTSAFAFPICLEAPGALVATSNKADLWALTAALRAKDTGARVWVFDPQRITYSGQSWWWNPLRGVTTVERAQRLASHFIIEVQGDQKHEFWSSAAEDLLTSLFLAAGVAGLSLVEVYDWLSRPTLPTPVELLRQHGLLASASGLAGRQGGAEETREGVYETARTAARCLRDPAILAWVTPPPFPLDEFVTDDFAATKESLYLLSKEAAGGAAPIVASFVDRVMQDAITLAERKGGRLDPPLTVLLDEAANICKVADLPKLCSHLGSRGIIAVTILQSYPQGVGVWGETGMDTMWAANTIKLVGAGMDDVDFLSNVSRLVGDHDVATRAVHQGGGGGGQGGSYGENISLRRQPIMPVEDLRQLPKGRAVLLATGCKAAMVDLQSWYTGPRQAEIAAAEKEALAGLTARAQADAGSTEGDSEESPDGASKSRRRRLVGARRPKS